MLNAILVLVRARLHIARNTFWRGKLRRKIGLVVLLTFAGFAMWGLYSFSSLVVRSLNSPAFARLLREAAQVSEMPEISLSADAYLNAVPSVALFLALLMLLFSSFNSVLSSLYLSGDLDMLLIAPVPMRAVFIVKFFGGLLVQYAVLFALLAPVLLGYGQGIGYGAPYYVVTLLVLALLPLLPAGLGALLVMAVVRVLPARRAREIVSILGALIGVTFYILSQVSQEVAPRLATINTAQALLQLDLPLLPSAWAGRALVATGAGEWLTLLAYGGLFVILSLAAFISCLLLTERLYYVGWSNMAVQGGQIKRRAKPAALPSLSFTLPPMLAQSAAIAFKDWRLFPRDLRNLQQLIFPLALAGLWTFRLLTNPTPSVDATANLEASYWINQLISLGGTAIAFFICIMLSNAIAGTGVSREGKAFWILKLAPISPQRILLGKLFVAYVPFPTVGIIFLTLLAFIDRSLWQTFIFQAALLLLVGLGGTSIALVLGALFPNLNWENPQQQTTFRAGCLGTMIYPVYLLGIVVVVMGAMALADILGQVYALAGGVTFAIQAGGWALALAITAVVMWAAMSLGARGLERIDL